MKKTFVVLIIAFLLVIEIFAVAPPKPGLGSSAIQRYSNIKKIVSKDSLNNLNSPSLRKVPVPKFDWKGNIKLIIIPMEFNDVKFNVSDPVADIRDKVFNMANNLSLANFYNKSSYGQTTISEAIITDVVTSTHDIDYYYGDSNGPVLAQDALQLAYTTDADFKTICDDPSGNAISVIDTNGDGAVRGADVGSSGVIPDKVFYIVIHAGPAGESNGGSNIWSHQWELSSGSAYTVGNTQFYTYLTVGELNLKDSTGNVVGSPVPILCHELGHHLGASDFYDNSSTSYQGVGRWSIMSGGVWQGYYIGGNSSVDTTFWGVDFDGYHKWLFGWLDPVELNNISTTEIELLSLSDLSLTDASSRSKMLYKYTLNSEGTEYYLFENRSNSDYDAKLFNTKPIDNGMLIYHFDENVKFSGEEVYLDNFVYHYNDTTHPACWLVRADNNANSYWDENDLYPITTNDSFTPSSTPSSYSYFSDNAPIIKNIARGVSNITFSIDNSKNFIAGVARTPLDPNSVSIITRPNFKIKTGSLITGNLRSTQEVIALSFEQVGRVYIENVDFSALAPSEYTIEVSATDTSDTVHTEAAWIYSENLIYSRLVVARDNTFEEFSLHSPQNYIISENNIDLSEATVHKDYELIPTENIEIVPHAAGKKGVYIRNGDKYELLRSITSINKTTELIVLTDNELPKINQIDEDVFEITDKYSGVKDITIKDENNKYYSAILKSDRLYLEETPEKEFLITVLDFAGNKSVARFLPKKAGERFTSVNVFPCPADSFVEFELTLNVPTSKLLKIYDNSGRLIYKQRLMAGNDHFIWDLTDRRGNPVANGVYHYEIEAGSAAARGKLVVLR